MKQKLVIATRGSKLAIRQSEIVKQLLLQKFPNVEVEFLLVTTQGDTDQKTPLSSFGNTGVFVKGLEEKLLSSDADLAVHSLKDVPASGCSDPIAIGFRSADMDLNFSEIKSTVIDNSPELENDNQSQLILAAFPEREDVRDVLVSAEGINWRDLKPGSIIGTSSPARHEQLKLIRPDLIFKDIRGNVETRIQKVLNGEYDATILAAAGLKRLGFKIEDESYFTLDEIVPSPGQGALAIQIHKNNTTILEMVHQLNNKTIEMQVTSERAFMQIIGGGCRFPVAAHAEIRASEIIFRGIAYKPGFEKLEKIKIKTTENDLLERAEEVAKQIISKYKTKT